MTSLREKLRMAKAMEAKIEEASAQAQAELSTAVEEAPAIEGDLPTGAATVGNNQASPMAALRARMAARKAKLAEPEEATQAATALAPTPVEDWEEPVDADAKSEPELAPEDALLQKEANLAAAVEAERVEARRKLDEQQAIRKRADELKAGMEATRMHTSPAPAPAPTEKKLTLKEKIAAKKAMQEREKQAKLHKPIPEHTPPTRRPEPRPAPSNPVVKTSARLQREAREAQEHKIVHRPDGSLRPESKAEQSAREQSAAPGAKPMSLAERLRAKREAANKVAQEPTVPTNAALEKSIDSFGKQTLPAQPANASQTAVTSHKVAAVQVEETGIQGAPQVKAIEEQAGVAANRKAVKLNAKQEQAAKMFAEEERSCVMIGAAGTGKTTGVRGVLRRLLELGKLKKTADYKRQGGSGLKDRVKSQYNVAICAFTRRAAINIMESVTSQEGLEEFKYCCQTVHNLLEYAPEYYDEYDDETGEFKQKMRFSPHRDSANPIDCDWLIIEEASMVDLILWEKLMDAMKPGTKVLFLGDINQLPPVFGLPILVYAMHKLPVVQLTEVYRQSVGPVLRNAHNILKGVHVEEETTDDQAFVCYEEFKTDTGKTSLKRHVAEKGSPIMAGESKMSAIYSAMFNKLYETGRYDPEQDMIISPFNVGDLGTLHMNQCLAQFIGDSRNAIVHEVLAGFHKHYLAVGDKVMVERQDGYITAIHHNTDYMGSLPKPAGSDLSRFGVRILGREGSHEDIDLDEAADVNFDLNAIGEKTAEELKRAASHIVEVTLESGEVVTLSSSGQFAPEKFTLGYCITGHKSQGSEWRNVYIIMHKKHHSLLTREWLYTTVTRARKQCTLLCKPFSIEKALGSQRITGDTIEDKLAWFTSGAVDNLDEIEVEK